MNTLIKEACYEVVGVFLQTMFLYKTFTGTNFAIAIIVREVVVGVGGNINKETYSFGKCIGK